jgi:hypothetical protein
VGVGGTVGLGGMIGSGGTDGLDAGGDAGLYECDPVLQTCQPGLRCDLPDGGDFVFRCIPDLGGQGQQNDVCTDGSADCARGSTCLQDTDRFGNPIGPARCTFYCYLDTDCPTGNHCLATGITGPTGDITFGICLPNR